MSVPVMAAAIITVALGTLFLFLYGSQTGDQQETQHSYSNTRNRDNNRLSNNVRRGSGWSDDDECTICYIPLTSESCLTLTCTHRYHRKCIETWKKMSWGSPSCPICRRKI